MKSENAIGIIGGSGLYQIEGFSNPQEHLIETPFGAPSDAIMEYSSSWRVRSWDRFILPRPFSTVRVIFGQPHRVAATVTAEAFEQERLHLQDAMMKLVEMR